MTPITALHDGRAGNARQALALARALTPRTNECMLVPRAPWRWLAPRRLPISEHAYGAAFAQLLKRPPPQIAIGCGRQAALATRVLRTHGSRVVQILNPRTPLQHWDLIVAPEHDALHGENIIPLLGSLHPVDDAYLLRALSAFHDLALLPSPHTVLLVGGPTRHAPLGDSAFAALLAQLAERTHQEGGSFSAIASRRTPPAWRHAIGAIDHRLPGLRWRDTGDGANPYAGLLAYADRIVCTPDSVNMLSEAAATYAPLFVWASAHTDARLRQFLGSLQARGRVHVLDAAMPPFESTPLRECERIANVVRSRLGLPSK